MEYQKGDRVVVICAKDGREELRGEVQSVTGTSADIDLVLIKTDQGMHVTRHASFVRHESIVDHRTTRIDPNRTVEIAYSEYETLQERAKLYDRMHEFVEARTRTYERKLQTKNERLHESRIGLKEALEQVKTLSVNLDRAVNAIASQSNEIKRLTEIIQSNGIDPSVSAAGKVDWTRVGG